MTKVYVHAEEDIPLGARILVRGTRANLAPDTIANATVAPRPSWAGKKIRAGQTFTALMDDGIGQRDLHAIANGPIMDEARIYLPAGKISEAEFRERQRSIILDDRDAPQPA